MPETTQPSPTQVEVSHNGWLDKLAERLLQWRPPDVRVSREPVRPVSGGWEERAVGSSRSVAIAVGIALTVLSGCVSGSEQPQAAGHSGHESSSTTPSAATPTPTPTAPAVANQLPGMPAVSDAGNVYSDAGAGMLSPAARAARPLVYVPHNSGSVWVIDPATFQVVDRFPAGREIQHVVPSWDMRTLYATDDLGYTVTPIDPVTGRPGAPIPVDDPYNMYFTPDGAAAISVAEALRTLVFYDPHTWQEQSRLVLPDCAGVDHADFTADGRTAVFSCEFAGRVAVIDVPSRTLVRMMDMPVRNTHMGPQDVKLAPDGSRFFVADSDQGSLWVLDGAATQVIGELKTGPGAHGLYLSRDAGQLYVTNRRDNSISVLDARTGAPITKWALPAPSSPDMGGVTADGSQLWLSGRYNAEVYVISTADGHLLARIPVADGPHGLCVWPQPGRYSLGHTGVTR
jgi:DNA-binding beta-propeller fold protein YncE